MIPYFSKWRGSYLYKSFRVLDSGEKPLAFIYGSNEKVVLADSTLMISGRGSAGKGKSGNSCPTTSNTPNLDLEWILWDGLKNISVNSIARDPSNFK